MNHSKKIVVSVLLSLVLPAVAEMSDNETVLYKTMENAFPKFRKVGAVAPWGEVSPFVFKGRLMRMELRDSEHRVQSRQDVKAVIRDVSTGKIVGETGEGCYYHSVFVEGDRIYLTGTLRSGENGRTGDTVMVFESTDLVHWTKRILIRNPGWRYFNTTLAKGPDGYVLALESNDERHAEQYFTMFFATSKDLKEWTFLPNETAYPKLRYCGGPFLVFCNGWYYLTLVTAMPCARFCTYIFRTRDFRSWEVGRYNPMLMWDDADRRLAPNAVDFTPELENQVRSHFICNASDLEMCEFEGKTVLNYLVGDQRGFAYEAEAWYDGPMQELLERYFR